MELSDALLGALIGGGSAVSAQVISSVVSAMQQRKQLQLQRRQLEIAAANAFNERKIEAIVLIRDLLQGLSDGMEKPADVYRNIRPFWIYLAPETERLVAAAIHSRISGASGDGSELQSAVEALKVELIKLTEV
ncbi:hypothetical protein E3C22_24295 [Jiella endophytica]|uniref:Uncharacterized protein n=1 Tax=Jiella endophytica TaxID=2558362 RepID=A0A4Y8R723_9HYPH|nr:hypothetical protein [Jiella endophytica]TFF17190.1 hypothetical protein E3C22_24295 [Jiella endophytica]